MTKTKSWYNIKIMTEKRKKEIEPLEREERLKQKEERAVLVTTAHRGVFMGYASKTNEKTIELKRARLCVYWTAEMHGFMGLASMGPGKGCRIGPAVDITLHDVTSVVEVSPEAEAKWNAAPWQ